MGKQSNKDPNTFAKRVFENLLDKLDPEAGDEVKPEPDGKDPKQQRAGRIGGLKGGKVRAMMLSVKERKDIAEKAAKSRWNKLSASE